MKVYIKCIGLFLGVSVFLSSLFFFTLYPEALDSSLFSFYDPILSFIFVSIEWLVVCLAFTLLYGRVKLLNLFCYFFFIFVLVVQITQFMSLYNSQEYINLLALAHASLVGLLITFKTLLLVCLCVLFPVTALLILRKKLLLKFEKMNMKRIFISIGLVIFLGALVVGENNAIAFKNSKLSFKANQESMVVELVKLFSSYQGKRVQEEPFIKLEEKDVLLAKEHGIFINQNSDYPLIKDFFYRKSFKFKKKINPNIIVFFVESLNSRLLGVYGGEYQNISPNIDSFAKEATVVNNYFNHAFPTIVGLRAQLCSSFPRVQSSLWANAKSKFKLNRLRCLPHVLNDNGYQTTYLGYSHPQETFFKDQMQEFGFNESSFYSNLLELYGSEESSTKPARGHYGNSDKQMFSATLNFLEKREAGKPLFLSVSTIETHPGMDPLNASDIPFDSLTLRSVNNLDTQFGVFWDHFKSSKYYKNTIVILTSDHAHVPNMDYIKVAGSGYTRINYFDPNTMIIYDPTKDLPKSLHTSGTSIDFAPTVTHLLDIKNEKNHFLGMSLFSDRDNVKSGLGLINQSKFLINRERDNILDLSLKKCDADSSLECRLYRVLRYTQYLEFQDKTWPNQSK